MKLILERWDKYKIIEQVQDSNQTPRGVNTYGDLKKVLQAIELKRVGKLAADKVVDYLGSLIPGASAVINVIKDARDTFEFVKNMYSADDNFKTQTGLDRLNVNDNVSAIVDDNVEAAFLKNLTSSLMKIDDNTPINDWNATQELQKYLTQQFQGHAVKK